MIHFTLLNLLSYLCIVYGASITMESPNVLQNINSAGTAQWSSFQKSNNCNGEMTYSNSIAQSSPNTNETTDILSIRDWDWETFGNFGYFNSVTVHLTTLSDSPSYFTFETYNLKDACNNTLSATPNITTNNQQSNYKFLFPAKLSADYLRGTSFGFEFAAKRIAAVFTPTYAVMCVTIEVNFIESTPSPAVIGVAICSPSSTPTPSPTPSAISSASASSAAKHSSGGAGGSHGGVIVGALIGSLVGIAFMIGIAFFIIRRKKKTQDQKDDAEKPAPEVGLAAAPTYPRNSLGRASLRPEIDSTSELYLDDIKLKGMLGKGKFGEVYEGLWHGTTAVACKKLKNEDKEEFENEIMLLMKLNHPNIVRCLGMWMYPETNETFMILELLRLGSLTTFLRNAEKQHKELGVANLVEMCVNAASGMVFLEQKNIVHRDLGARNLLVTETDGRYVVKISDFGLSRQVEESEAVYSSKAAVFPVKWSPPEVINFRQFTAKSDVWSFGITMWEIFEFGKVPYPTKSNDEAAADVLKGYRLPQPQDCPDEVYKVMMNCWQFSPEARPNFKSIHEALQKVLKTLRGEQEEPSFYTITEDADKNYTYNNNAVIGRSTNDTYNTMSTYQPDTYNTN